MLETIVSSDEAKDALEHALLEDWEAIHNSLIKLCFESTPRRRNAVLKSKG